VAEGACTRWASWFPGRSARRFDQAYFYLFRGRLPQWLARYPSLQRKTAPLVDRVRRHASLMVLLIRFAPGLRIALAAACAAADVPPRTMSLLNLLSSFVWAAALLVLVAWLGPAYLAQFGLAGWRGAGGGLTLLVLFRVLVMRTSRN
jgi:membrane protein DedA with SNARE-associated domain